MNAREELRALAADATPDADNTWDNERFIGAPAVSAYIAAASPDRITALLDDLDAAEREREWLRAKVQRVRDLCADARRSAGGPFVARLDVLSIERALDGDTPADTPTVYRCECLTDEHEKRHLHEYAATPTERCSTCGGLNGAHGSVHTRHDNGGGSNRPCPNTPPCGSCGEPGPYTITLRGEPTRACLRHLNHWRTPTEPDADERLCPDDGKLCSTSCPHECIDLAGGDY